MLLYAVNYNLVTLQRVSALLRVNFAMVKESTVKRRMSLLVDYMYS